MRAKRIVAAVQTGVEQIEMQEFARPPVVPDEAILRVEASGICGGDIPHSDFGVRSFTIAECSNERAEAGKGL